MPTLEDQIASKNIKVFYQFTYIPKVGTQTANPHSIRLIQLSQIRQFLGFASPRFANPQIIHHRTERMKHLEKVRPFSALSWQNHLKLSRKSMGQYSNPARQFFQNREFEVGPGTKEQTQSVRGEPPLTDKVQGCGKEEKR